MAGGALFCMRLPKGSYLKVVVPPSVPGTMACTRPSKPRRVGQPQLLRRSTDQPPLVFLTIPLPDIREDVLSAPTTRQSNEAFWIECEGFLPLVVRDGR